MMQEEELLKRDPNLIRINRAFNIASKTGKSLAKQFMDMKKEGKVNSFADFCAYKIYNSLFTDEDLTLIFSLIEAGMHIQRICTISEIDQNMSMAKIHSKMQEESEGQTLMAS